MVHVCKCIVELVKSYPANCIPHTCMFQLTHKYPRFHPPKTCQNLVWERGYAPLNLNI